MKRVRAPGPIPVIAALIAVALIVVGFIGCGRAKPTADGEEAAAATTGSTPVAVATAVHGGIERTLEVSGTIQTADEVNVVAEVPGKAVAVNADVGDYVRRGQMLVRLDSQAAAAQADQASAGVHSARVGLSQAEESLRLTDETTASSMRAADVAIAAARERLKQAEAARDLVRSQVSSQVEQARTALHSAETQLAEVRAGARDQQRRQAEAQVRQAKANLDLAAQTDARYRALLDSGVIAQQQYDQVHTQYLVAQSTHEQALEALSLVEEGARTEQVRLAELAVEQARERLRLAEANTAQVKVSEQDVRAAEQAVRQAQEGLRSAEAARRQVELRRREIAAARAGIQSAEAARRVSTVQLSKHSVVSPISGTVSARFVDPGEAASPGVPLLTIVGSEMLYVEADVSEQDLAQVEVGQAAEVRVDGVADQVFVGEIITLAPSVESASRTGTVRVRLVNPGDQVRPGMFARATLVIQRSDAGVIIARDALLTEDGVTYVFVVENNVAHRREVEVGIENASRVEVLSGLREGDQVVVEGQDQLQDGDAVTIADAPAARSGPR